MSRFGAVLFDNDGVLVDSEALSQRVLSSLLTEAGLPTTPEESAGIYLGMSMESVRTEAERRFGGPLPVDLIDRYYEGLFSGFERELVAVEGVREVVEALDVPFCVASSGSPERIDRTLTLTGLRPLFGDRLYSAEQVERGKPHPDLFLFAAEQLGVDPSECAVIEDSPLGIAAGNAAGATTFGYAGITPRSRLAEATGGAFTHMRELPALLGLPG